MYSPPAIFLFIRNRCLRQRGCRYLAAYSLVSADTILKKNELSKEVVEGFSGSSSSCEYGDAVDRFVNTSISGREQEKRLRLRQIAIGEIANIITRRRLYVVGAWPLIDKDRYLGDLRIFYDVSQTGTMTNSQKEECRFNVHSKNLKRSVEN